MIQNDQWTKTMQNYIDTIYFWSEKNVVLQFDSN